MSLTEMTQHLFLRSAASHDHPAARGVLSGGSATRIWRSRSSHRGSPSSALIRLTCRCREARAGCVEPRRVLRTPATQRACPGRPSAQAHRISSGRARALPAQPAVGEAPPSARVTSRWRNAGGGTQGRGDRRNSDRRPPREGLHVDYASLRATDVGPCGTLPHEARVAAPTRTECGKTKPPCCW